MLILSILRSEERAGGLPASVLILQLSIWGVKFRGPTPPPPPRPSPARAPALPPRAGEGAPSQKSHLRVEAPLSRSGWACGGRTGEGPGEGADGGLPAYRRA